MTRRPPSLGTADRKHRGQNDIASMRNWQALVLGHAPMSLTCGCSSPRSDSRANSQVTNAQAQSLSDTNPLGHDAMPPVLRLTGPGRALPIPRAWQLRRRGERPGADCPGSGRCGAGASLTLGKPPAAKALRWGLALSTAIARQGRIGVAFSSVLGW